MNLDIFDYALYKARDEANGLLPYLNEMNDLANYKVELIACASTFRHLASVIEAALRNIDEGVK